MKRPGPHALALVTLITVTSFIPLGTALQTPSEDPLHVPDSSFEVAIDHSQGLVGDQLPVEMGPMLEQEQRNLDTAEALLAIEEAGQEDGLAEAIALATRGTRHQVATLGLEPAKPVPLTGYEKPSAALTELAHRHNVTLKEEQRAELAELDSLNEPVRTALTRVVDAFLALDTATQRTYEGADLSELRELRPEHAEVNPSPMPSRTHQDLSIQTASDPGEGLAEAGVDLAPVLATRTQFLHAVYDLHTALDAHPIVPTSSCSPTQVAPAFSIDSADCDNDYTEDYALLLDLGGQDVYHNNAGGSNFADDTCSIFDPPGPYASAALLDLGRSNDEYGDPVDTRKCGANGGGWLGAGFLFDRAGDDMYHAAKLGTNGGGSAGVGFLLDAEGTDLYAADGGGTNGGGYVGVGTLVDSGGDDTYMADGLGTNGGAKLNGVGLLIDSFGADSYQADGEGTNGGAWEFAAGFLLDGFGDDSYDATKCGTNGGGPDTNCRDIGGVPGWVKGASGFLFDAWGKDKYSDAATDCSDCTDVPKGIVGSQIDSDDTSP